MKSNGHSSHQKLPRMKNKSLLIWIPLCCSLFIANFQHLDLMVVYFATLSDRYSLWGSIPLLLVLLAIDIVAVSFYLGRKIKLNWKIIFLLLIMIDLLLFGYTLTWITSSIAGMALMGEFPFIVALLLIDLLALSIKKYPHGNKSWIIHYSALLILSLSQIALFTFYCTGCSVWL